MDCAKRHLMNMSAKSAGKAHKTKKKTRISASDLDVLLKHNEVVGKINSMPPIFTIWDHPDCVSCAAKKCVVQHGESLLI